ncbi:hypothetical protein [Synechococcus sp. PROS-9-1]|uniref:hypothetical protein n=1 Tax=Synechococcus sp. PROS-9-1 TaxID=1968775 RepID=UPI001647298E|nr:hypothetical protein [Synechococcus sp. PROS-9-1]
MASTAPRIDPRSMQWQTNGELHQGDLIALVCHLRKAECGQHSDELSRLGQRHTENSKTSMTMQKQPA